MPLVPPVHPFLSHGKGLLQDLLLSSTHLQEPVLRLFPQSTGVRDTRQTAVSPKHKLVRRVSGYSWCIMVQALDVRQGIYPVQVCTGRYPAQPILEVFACPLRRTICLVVARMAAGPPDPEQGADSLPPGAHKLWSIVNGDQ